MRGSFSKIPLQQAHVTYYSDVSQEFSIARFGDPEAEQRRERLPPRRAGKRAVTEEDVPNV